MERTVSLPLMGIFAATRGMLGAGIGLLLAERMDEERRRKVGLTLATIGAASTIPLAMRLFGHRNETVSL